MRLAVLIAAVLLVLAGVVLLPKSGGPGLSSLGFTRIGALRMDEANAEQQVIAIVNQPVTHLPQTENAFVFSPGWFHDGAIKPDFDTVDVRTTQEFPYDKGEIVTSDVSPSEMFVWRKFEFNAMTLTRATMPPAHDNFIHCNIGRSDRLIVALRA